MKLLLVASDRMEFSGLVDRCQGLRPAALRVDWSRTGRMGEYDVLLVANGVGGARAAAAVAAAENFAADGLVSLGYCGGLAPELGVADIVVADAVTTELRRLAVRPLEQAPGHTAGVVASVDTVAQSAEAKRALRATGAVGVEMEAAGVGRRAEALGRPFYCIKAVTDLWDESMGIDFNSALRPDGHFDTIKILTSSLRHPMVRLPELFQLRKRCLRASRVLGDFVADCRF